MAERAPTDTKNLDIYGHDPLEWSRARDEIVALAPTPRLAWFLGTVRPDGRPHAAGFGAAWHDGDLYLVTGPGHAEGAEPRRQPGLHGLRAPRDARPRPRMRGAARHRRRRRSRRSRRVYREGGWPAEVEGDAFTAPYSAPSAGPPPWHLYRLTCHTAFAVATAEPHGATRWRFER